jgi:hypothetical protein
VLFSGFLSLVKQTINTERNIMETTKNTVIYKLVSAGYQPAESRATVIGLTDESRLVQRECQLSELTDCRLDWRSGYVLEAEFPTIDGGDDFEGTPSEVKRKEMRARKALKESGKWLPLSKARGRGPGGQFLPSIPGWVLQTKEVVKNW